MKLLRTFLGWFKGPPPRTGDLAEAILDVYAEAGASLHDDFQKMEIPAAWTVKIADRPQFRQYLFMTTQGHAAHIEELLTRLYRQPPHVDENGTVFGSPTEPSAPIAGLTDKGKERLHISIFVSRR